VRRIQCGNLTGTRKHEPFVFLKGVSGLMVGKTSIKTDR
jgi:hypothetical protein